mmetsp:Transcript_88211/g.156168  ORF Transcript_88211/g.156168 Transcript_88211/m.156168 type:complete len:214 (+) Transcript_88211:524-1165(+)
MVTSLVQGVWQVSDGLFTLMAFISMGAVFAATAVFFLECKELETEFVSIPRAMWWAFPTITGVGYGDMVPQTSAGRAASVFAMLAGVLVTALAGTMMTSSVIEKNMAKTRLKRSNSVPCLGSPDDCVSPKSLAFYAVEPSISSGNHGQSLNLEEIEEKLQEALHKLHRKLSGKGDFKSQDHLNFLMEQSALWFRQVKCLADEVKDTSTGTTDS